MMLRLNQVSKSYQKGPDVLSQVSFALDKGEMAFLTGHSGAGKSTLLKLIAVMERCTNGNILFGGHNLNRLRGSDIPLIRRQMGLIFQDYRLLSDRTVFENVALPLIVSGYGRAEIRRRVSAALDKVNLLSKAKRYPVVLSGGEQQRVGVARAVVSRPAMILADEPTGNLDPELSIEIMHLFEQFMQVGVTVLIATHDQELVSRMGYRTLTLDQGQLVEQAEEVE